MLTSTHGIAQTLLDLRSAERAAGRLGQQLNTGSKLTSPADDPALWAEADRAQSTTTYLDAVHTSLNEVAGNVHVADMAMDAISRHIDIMKQQLAEALDYLPGDPGRDQRITNFNTIRQQIDLLIQTTRDPGARRIMADPAVDPTAGDQQIITGPDGARKTIHAREVHTGPTGLNIPALDPALTNDEVDAALAGLVKAKATLASRRAGLATDAQDLIRVQENNTHISDLYRIHAESLRAVDFTEAAVELQSVEVRRSLASQILGSITGQRSKILDLLQ
jgi:flagellin-like hook-associated protein FlgL